MSPSLDTEVSKFLSYVLRHAPESAGLQLDANGWTDFAELRAKVLDTFAISSEDLDRIIAENPKKRFTRDGSRIRAAQGHSVDVALALEPQQPADILYHGTQADKWPIIAVGGLLKMDRTHVHLSQDMETARIVAIRRKGPHALLSIDAAAMFSQGFPFFLSDNGVWLTDHVPAKFISLAASDI